MCCDMKKITFQIRTSIQLVGTQDLFSYGREQRLDDLGSGADRGGLQGAQGT